LEAENKLKGASYHLERMSELYLKNQEQFTHEFESFLANIRSVPDVMLEDYNRKFELGIGLEDRLTPKTFEKKARQHNCQDALNFLKWWTKKIEDIRSSSLGPLFEMRNISIHRKQVQPDILKITIEESISISASVSVCDLQGNVVSKSEAKPNKIKTEPAKVEWAFKEYPNDNALGISKSLFDEVQKMVKESQVLLSK
jgi:hypothetical protein